MAATSCCGGWRIKDRHPFPVPTNVYDHTIGVLESAVRNAKLGREE